MFGVLASIAMLGSVEPLRVEWKAHEDCPSVNEYWTFVVTRSNRIRRASVGEVATLARIEIRRSGARSVATFVLGSEKRELAADSCREVVDAVALMTVLALDPDALAEAPAPEPAPPPKPPPPVEPAAPKPKPAPVVVGPPIDLDVAPPLLPPVPEAERSWSASAIAGGQLLDVGRTAAYGMIAGFELGFRGTTARLSYGHSGSDLLRSEGGSEGSITFDTARLDVCPWALGDQFRVAGCAAAVLGVFRDEIAVPAARTDVRTWATVGASVKAEMRLSSWLGIDMDLGAVLPLTRIHVVTGPSDTLYQSGIVLLSSQLALKVRFS